MPTEDRNSLLAIHVAVFLFGFPGLLGKWIALSPPLIVFGRVMFASLALGLIIGAGRMSFRIAPGRDLRLLLLCGAVLAVHWTTFFQSIRVSSVAVGLLSYSSFPVFTVFLEPLAEKERLDPRNLVFAFFCLLGVFLIIPEFRLSDVVFQGVCWGLVSGLTFAVLSILNRTLSRRQSSFHIAFYQDLFAGVFLLPFVFAAKPSLSPKNWILLGILGVFCTAGAHTLFIQGLKRIKAQTAGIISSLEPVYGIVLAFLFLRETPSARTIAGGLVILGAVFLVTLKAGIKRRPGTALDPAGPVSG